MASIPAWRSLVPATLALALLAACAPGDGAPAPAGSTAPAASSQAEAKGGLDDAVAGLRARLSAQLPTDQLAAITPAEVTSLASDQERQQLASGFIRFTVDAPATVHVLLSPDSDQVPFWLSEQGFEPSGLGALVDGDDQFQGWSRQVPAGEVALGVHSVEMGVKPYLVMVGPAEAGGLQPQISQPWPDGMSVATVAPGVRAFADDTDEIDAVDAPLQGLALLQTLEGRENAAGLAGYFRTTPYPSGAGPDHVVLTWSGDPATSQSIQWRTAPGSAHSLLRYAPEGGEASVVEAATTELRTPDVANDPHVLRHTAVLEGLEPATTYRYAIGDGERWGEERAFTTAPAQGAPFSFIYMGDAQNGLDSWGGLVRKARARHPQAAFYVMAGDLVNWGERRDDWDLFFHNARGVFDSRPLVPAVGNHEVDQGHAELYVAQFDLPRNGPDGVEPERVYAMEYSDTLFVVLDSNLEPGPQVEWLDATLGGSDATWKFVVFHHPLYSPRPGDRGQPELKAAWIPVFEKHGVDLVLTGDDHAYMRSHPLRGEQVMDSPADGPIYILSVAGTKMYEQEDAPYVAKRFTDTSTYQVIDIDGGRLEYTAYDIDGQVMDAFTIEK